MRHYTVTMLFAGASAAQTAAQQAPDGAQLYGQYCSRCHDAENMPTTMLPVPIQQLPAVHLYELMSYYFMKRHAATLAKAEKRAIAEHVSGSEPGSLPDPLVQISQSAYCSAKSDLPVDPLAGATWNGWSPNLANGRFQSAEAAGLSASEVGDLELTWAFGLPGSTVDSLQATVVGERVLFGTSVGLVFALDDESECIHWAQETAFGVRATVVVGPRGGGGFNVFVADSGARVYA
ncbi:MAG: hypothetical protein VYE68_05220 [Acidobacteriota bacterium]|nr:hypothetical protein [Acidobacteriota bacterium]